MKPLSKRALKYVAEARRASANARRCIMADLPEFCARLCAAEARRCADEARKEGWYGTFV